MDNIKVLEKTGLQKVSNETHIEKRYLRFMIDCDYDKLDYVNTIGFVKILSREYKLDLTAWSEAFEAYWIENRKEDANDGMFIVVEEKKKGKKLLLFLFILLMIFTTSVLYSIFQDNINLSQYIENEDATYQQPSIVQEAQQSLDEANNSFGYTPIEKPVLEDTNESSDDTEIVMDDNTTQDVVTQNIVPEKTEPTIEVDTKNEVKVDAITETKTDTKVKQEIKSVTTSKEASITPKTELWVGIIYLDNNKRKSFIGKSNYTIDLSRDQIILTGHGNFKLDVNEEEKVFKQQAPMRFLVKKGNLTQIDLKKFKELNKGASW